MFFVLFFFSLGLTIRVGKMAELRNVSGDDYNMWEIQNDSTDVYKYKQIFLSHLSQISGNEKGGGIISLLL